MYDNGTWKTWHEFKNSVQKELDNLSRNVNEPDKWAKEVWNWATKEGFVDGTRPRDTVTRQELVAVIERLVNRE